MGRRQLMKIIMIALALSVLSGCAIVPLACCIATVLITGLLTPHPLTPHTIEQISVDRASGFPLISEY